MSYFHELVGGPDHGHEHLLDANIDWGQDLLELRRWMEANRVGSQLHLAYFGWNDPLSLKLSYRPFPQLITDTDGQLISGDPSNIIPGWYAISVNSRLAYRHYGHEKENYAWLTPYSPTAKAGYSIWIYYLDEAQVAEIRSRLR